MTLSQRASIPPHVLVRELGDEIVLLHLESGTYFGLDPIGARMWQLLAGNKSLGEVCDVMVGEFDVSRDRLEADVRRLADELVAKNLIALG